MSDLAVGEFAVHVVADTPPDIGNVAHAAPTQRLHVIALGGTPAPAHALGLKNLQNCLDVFLVAETGLRSPVRGPPSLGVTGLAQLPLSPATAYIAPSRQGRHAITITTNKMQGLQQ